MFRLRSAALPTKLGAAQRNMELVVTRVFGVRLGPPLTLV